MTPNSFVFDTSMAAFAAVHELLDPVWCDAQRRWTVVLCLAAIL